MPEHDDLTGDKTAQAHDIVKKHVWWTAGLGIVPVPLLNLAAVTAVHLKMLKNLSDHYGVAFSENMGKSAIGSLAGGLAPTATSGIARSLVGFVPVVGGLLNMILTPAAAGASTYALGKVFIQHFESGGTLLDFDPAAMKDYFSEQYQKGKEFMSSSKQEEEPPAARPAATEPAAPPKPSRVKA